MRIYRAWFNQPSTLQEHHNLHGTRCIAIDEEDNSGSIRVFFTEGKVYSMMVMRECLSEDKG